MQNTNPENIFQRIDAIIAEMQQLRQSVTKMQQQITTPSQSIVDELFGSLGPGTLDEYDEMLDWNRFAFGPFTQ